MGNVTNDIYGSNMTRKDNEQELKAKRPGRRYRKGNAVETSVVRNENQAEHRALVDDNERLHRMQEELRRRSALRRLLGG